MNYHGVEAHHQRDVAGVRTVSHDARIQSCATTRTWIVG